MDAVIKPALVKSADVKPWPKGPVSDHVRNAPTPVENRPSREEAEAAVRALRCV